MRSLCSSMKSSELIFSTWARHVVITMETQTNALHRLKDTTRACVSGCKRTLRGVVLVFTDSVLADVPAMDEAKVIPGVEDLVSTIQYECRDHDVRHFAL